MWWYLIKESDDGIIVVYAYGLESYETTGKISYNRQTESFKILSIADGDTEWSVNQRLMGKVWWLITEESAPDEYMIATG